MANLGGWAVLGWSNLFLTFYFLLECLGLSDRSAASPHIAETKVEFHTISSDKYGYNVIWKPFPDFFSNCKTCNRINLITFDRPY